MPLFMDVHNSLPEGATAQDVAEAHKADLETQEKYGVRYINYWADPGEERCSASSRHQVRSWHTLSTARRTGWSPTRSTRSSKADHVPPAHGPGWALFYKVRFLVDSSPAGALQSTRNRS